MSERVMTRVLAVVPAVLVAVAVQTLTRTAPPLAVRVAAAGVIAISCWVAFRLLTAKLVVTGEGLQIRGVLYDADVPWSDLHGVDVAPAPRAMRALVWGLIHPQTVVVRTGTRTLRPVACMSGSDDRQVLIAVRAIEARTGTLRVPAQRHPDEPVRTA